MSGRARSDLWDELARFSAQMGFSSLCLWTSFLGFLQQINTNLVA